MSGVDELKKKNENDGALDEVIETQCKLSQKLTDTIERIKENQ